ncbi:ABC transporter ATP-binding protein [Allokutzneria oryzae]|uniref:ABC transporter ATP-binding protein n=1 Tax=Allokutzneria oryzae TaxID=1378989 RepID=A0ABV5ZTB6_9PSEU
MVRRTNGRGPAIQAVGLGKRYRRGWALRDCTAEVPDGSVTALVGPNGAGKSTLMSLVTGLARPTTGAVEVYGAQPTGAGLAPELAFLGQHKPLYPSLTVAETLRLGARMNPGWDAGYAAGLVTAAGVPFEAKVGTLSGGQRTRVALALVLGKRPRVLLLDEPLADLDPLAREDTLGTLLAEARGQGITVVLSSHVLAELEGVCDHLLLLGGGRVLLAGNVGDLVTEHHVISGPAAGPVPVPSTPPIADHVRGDQRIMLIKGTPPPALPGWRLQRPRLDVLALAYMRSSDTREVAA